MRSTYQLGAMMFDKQFSRAEQLEATAMEHGREIVDKAAGAVQGVKAALIANGLITGISTLVLVRAAFSRRRGARG